MASDRFVARKLWAWVLLLGAAACSGLAWAEKPDWVDGGKGGHKGGKGKHEDRQVLPVPVAGAYFQDVQRQTIRSYYAPQVKAGKCPPGLAKKGNGCLPPGQAKQWVVGQRLPGGVVTYPLPPDLRRRLGTPPAGHEFVRVAGDILLIAVGTSMVVDAIEDLTR